jgi:hypothetical protein
VDATDAGMPVGGTRSGDKSTPIVQEHPAARQGPQQNPALPGMRVRIPLGVLGSIETLGGNRDAVLSCGSCGRGSLSRRCVVAGCSPADATDREGDGGWSLVAADDQDSLPERIVGVGLLSLAWTRRFADFAHGVDSVERLDAAIRVGADRCADRGGRSAASGVSGGKEIGPNVEQLAVLFKAARPREG